MSHFSYQALDKQGISSRGIIEAESISNARDKLQIQGYYPLTIKPCDNDSAQRNSLKRFFKSKIKLLDIALLTRQLATLVAANLPIADCLESLIAQAEKKNLKQIISNVHTNVLEGYTLADSLRQSPEAFDDLYCSTIAAGEHSGKLDHILENLAGYIEKKVSMQRKVMQALIYPGIMLLLSIVIILFLLNYVVPNIIEVFGSSQQTLPMITKALLFVTHISQTQGPYYCIVLMILYFMIRQLLQYDHWQKRRDRFLLSLPLFGKIIKTLNTSRYANTLGMLLAAGTPINQAMQIANHLIRNRLIQDALQHAAIQVQEGISLQKALKNTGYFEAMTLQLIANGEKTGQLAMMLSRASAEQEQSLTHLIDTLLTLFEPFIIISMGSIVLFIVLAVLLPIFEMNQLII